MRDGDNGSGWSLVALTVFKTVRDLTSSGWVGSIPMHSRHAGATEQETFVDRTRGHAGASS
jgi:hypothetical protein